MSLDERNAQLTRTLTADEAAAIARELGPGPREILESLAIDGPRNLDRREREDGRALLHAGAKGVPVAMLVDRTMLVAFRATGIPWATKPNGSPSDLRWCVTDSGRAVFDAIPKPAAAGGAS